MARPGQAVVQSGQELLNVEEIARTLSTTGKAIRVAIAMGRTHLIPPSFKLGRRRVWLRREVERWLTTHARQKQRTFRRGGIAMNVPRIIEGLELVDDEGDEVVVSKINARKRTVTLDGDKDSYEMPLRDLRKALLAGEFGCVVDDGDDEDAEEEDEDAEEEDEEDEEK